MRCVSPLLIISGFAVRCIARLGYCGLLFGVDGFYFGGQGAVGQADANGLGRCGFGGGAEEVAFGIVDEGVAAVEDGEGGEGFEAGGGLGEARSLRELRLARPVGGGAGWRPGGGVLRWRCGVWGRGVGGEW